MKNIEEEIIVRIYLKLNIDIDTDELVGTHDKFECSNVNRKNINIYWDKSYSSDDGILEGSDLDEKLNKLEYKEKEITIESNGTKKTFYNEHGFTNRDLLDHILEIEKISRPLTNLFGEIDIYHVHFEGLWKQDDGSYQISWES
jgi:hypothetical protein